jgi:hypothetical protein
MIGPSSPRWGPVGWAPGSTPVLALAIVAAAMSAFPTGVGVAPTAAHPPIGPAVLALGHVFGASHPAVFAGATPEGPTVDSPALYRAYHSFTTPSPSAALPLSGRNRTHVSAVAPADRSPAAPAPGRPWPGASGGGWVAGTVVDSKYGTPLVGVYVSSSTGTVCTYCQVVQSNATGFFRVESDPGPTTIRFTTPLYVDNRTIATVVSGQVLSIGTVQMVHYATVEGIVATDLPGHPRIGGVVVSSISRDFGEGGPDVNLTLSNGSFQMYVDPLPAEIDFLPPDPAHLSNSTDVDTTPWQVLDLGVVLLEGGLVGDVRVVDALNGTVISGAGGQFCSNRIDGACFPSIPSPNSSMVVDTVPGPGFLVVAAAGYVTNVTQVSDVPSGTAGPLDLGTVSLLPLGDIEVTVNFTGGVPNSTWPAPSFAVVVCSLSGMYASSGGTGELLSPSCLATVVQVGQTVLAAASPLRDAVYVVRCYPLPNGFPVAEFTAAPGGCPTPIDNVTWANVTPDRTTYLGSLNVEAGTYLSGSIHLTGPQANSTAVVVNLRACSTVRIGECAPPVQTNISGPVGAAVAGCPTTAWAFCVPAPPGPDWLSVIWGPVHNSTWVTVPRGCCAQEGHPLDLGTIGLSTDLGPTGTVYGQVAIAGDPASVIPPGGWAAVVQVCSAVPSLQPCYSTTVDSATGQFFTTAPSGWDFVNVTSGSFRQNGTWIDVGTNNSTGTIELAEKGAVTGQIVSAATGTPVIESQISACNVGISSCHPLGNVTNSNGTFAFPLAGLPYPAGTFQFVVTASGFDVESTFANVSAGATTDLGRIRLPPIGSSAVARGPLASRGANSSTPTTGSWVTGRLLDQSNGLGAGLATILVCELLSSNACAYSTSTTSTGGEFNLSTVHGAYQLWLNSTYYTSSHVFLNATSAGTVDLGDLNLTGLPRVTGRVVIDPWESLASATHEGADQVIVTVCTSATLCGPSAATGPAGYFNASAPATGGATLQCIGGGPGAQEGNGLPGFESTSLPFTVAAGHTNVTGPAAGGGIPIPILGGIAGHVVEFGGAATRPAIFTAYGVTGNRTGVAAGAVTGGAGYYVAFLPAGATNLTVHGSASGLVPGSSRASGGPVAAGVVVPGPNVTLTRFGFVTATLQDTATGRPVSGAFLTVAGSGGSGVILVGNALSNGTGGVNVTAPPGTDSFSTGSTSYQNATGFVTVPANGLTAYGTISLSALANGGFVVVRSAEVNTVGIPVTPGAYDNVSARPVPAALVLETGGPGTYAGPILGNDLGQFFLAGMPLSAATVSITATGFNPLSVVRNLSGEATSLFSPLNMTAGGILEGTVVAEPKNVTVPYATVSACAVGASVCRNTVTTNASGVFWIWAPNGTVSVAVQSALYLSNLTRFVNVPSDSFLELGKIPVYSFGTIRGSVRGLPSGAILAGANVSVCSQYSPPRGCLADESVPTDANGSFSMQSPPGLYFLYATFPGYNASRFQFVLGPGQNLNVGVVVLQADGLESGTVVTPTGLPVAGATVLSCGSYSGAGCVSATSLHDGTFRLVAPPGPSQVTVSAAGYLDTVVGTSVVAGGFDALGTIVVQPAPPDVFEHVTGVVTASPGATALAGALLIAEEGGARVAEAYTLGTGSYDLVVRWGTPTVVVLLPGYRTASRTFDVHANLTGVNFSLTTMTYEVGGVAFDGGTGMVLAGVDIASNGVVLATSASDGTFHFALPNGTYSLLATHAPAGPVVYGSVPFPARVSGGPIVHDLTIPRTVVPLTGAVVDAATGRAVSTASVALWGSSGAELSNSATASAGSFEFAVGPGSYNVSVTAPGYEPANVTVATGAAGTRTTVALVELTPSRSSSNSILPEVAGAAAVAVAAAVGVGLVIRQRRARPPPGERYYRPGEPIAEDEPPVT